MVTTGSTIAACQQMMKTATPRANPVSWPVRMSRPLSWVSAARAAAAAAGAPSRDAPRARNASRTDRSSAQRPRMSTVRTVAVAPGVT